MVCCCTGECSLHRVDDLGARSDAGAEQGLCRERLNRLRQQGAASGAKTSPGGRRSPRLPADLAT